MISQRGGFTEIDTEKVKQVFSIIVHLTGQLDLSCDLIGSGVQFLLGHNHSQHIHDDCQCDDNHQNVNDRADIVCLGTVVMDIFSDFRNYDAPPGMQKSRQISQAAFSQVVF